MNTQDVRARGDPPEPRHAGGPRRPVRRAGRGLSGVRLDRQGPARRARRDRRRGRSDPATGEPAARKTACSSPPDRPTRTSIRSASSATGRAAGWGSRLPPKRPAAAPTSRSLPGPTTLEPPRVTEVVRVRSAAEMHQVVTERADRMDVVVMAAAVADYTPAERRPRRVHKSGETLTLVLRKTPDILGDLGRRRLATGRGPLLVGFAAETENLVPQAADQARTEARRSHRRQRRVAAGCRASTSRPTRSRSSDADGAETLPVQSKTLVAAAILDRVEKLACPQRGSCRIRLCRIRLKPDPTDEG